MFLRQNSSSVMMFWMVMLVLWFIVGSCVNFCCTMCREGSIGTEVKRALTSEEVITSPGSSLAFWICWTKCSAFMRWWGDWPTEGLMMYASSFVTPYVMEPLLDTMGLTWVPT